MKEAQKWVKKAVTVEAIQFTDETKDKCLLWAQDIQYNIQHAFREGKPVLLIPTLEGEMICQFGDYLIKEPFPTDWRKIYPCKQSIFEQTYQREEPIPPTEDTKQGESAGYDRKKEIENLLCHAASRQYTSFKVKSMLEEYASQFKPAEVPVSEIPFNAATEMVDAHIKEHFPKERHPVTHLSMLHVKALMETFSKKYRLSVPVSVANEFRAQGWDACDQYENGLYSKGTYPDKTMFLDSFLPKKP